MITGNPLSATQRFRIRGSCQNKVNKAPFNRPLRMEACGNGPHNGRVTRYCRTHPKAEFLEFCDACVVPALSTGRPSWLWRVICERCHGKIAEETPRRINTCSCDLAAAKDRARTVPGWSCRECLAVKDPTLKKEDELQTIAMKRKTSLQLREETLEAVKEERQRWADYGQDEEPEDEDIVEYRALNGSADDKLFMRYYSEQVARGRLLFSL
ncbi:hypothetical protein MMC19_005200 [Ptychographa xylographoides]|nr:hypothetical protein [Ptychographa xylographoides]